jgi:hypothetical protein
MALVPFNKHNCHAMLNTLYPPVEVSQPSSKLTIPLLMVQREGFFNYIKAVEARGPMCLQTLMKQGARNGEENGWSAVKRTLGNYLKLANQLIRESQEISVMEVYINSTPQVPPVFEDQRLEDPNVTPTMNSESTATLTPATDGKHSKNPSTSSSKSTGTANSSATSRTTSSSFEMGSRGSTLERLARELKKMKPRRLQVDEFLKLKSSSVHEKENQSPTSPPKSPQRSPLKSPTTPTKSLRFSSLRKMKSFGTLGELKHNNNSAASLQAASSAAPPLPYLDAESKARPQRRRPFEMRLGLRA